MSAPAPGPPERPRPSPVDSPYTNARSPSGHLVPYSPTPARRYSRDRIPWMTGTQTSLHEEPTPVDHNPSSVVAESITRPGSSHTQQHSHIPDALGHPPYPHSPYHRTIGFALETPPGNPGAESSPHAAHVHLHASQPEPHRSRTPLSQLSISQKSYNSQHSIGRASYREHHGPPAPIRTPASDQNACPPSPSSSPTPGRTALGVVAPFEDHVAPPKPGDPPNRFLPMSVNGVLRYENRKIRSPYGHDYKIEGMSFQYPETPEVPKGWTAYKHPEGALYFVHADSKTFTEVDICNEEIYADIEYFRMFLFSELEAEIENGNLPLSVDKVQLVLEPKRDEQDEWEAYDVLSDCKGVLSLPHKGLAIQAHYWSHWDLYPNFCEVTQELKDEVVDMILHAICDHLTSNRSSCPLNPEELKNHLSLIDRIDPAKTTKRGHCAIIIGRIMHIFYNTYFLNFYGEECARLNFDQTIHGWRYHPSFFMTTFAPLLFMTPLNNVRLLHRIFVDDIASKEKWNMFVSKLNSQLQETSVLATVLLNANVGFLPKQSGTGTSAEEFLSYMSLVASMASIILGLVFMGHSRTEARNTPFKAARFLHELRHDKHGLETLAIVYSLPHAFFMWGMILFFAAFAVQWCYPGDIVSRSSVGAFMLMVALLVAWCIWTARDRCDFWWFQPDPSQTELEEFEGEEWSSKTGFGFRDQGIPLTPTLNRKLSKSASSDIRATQSTRRESSRYSPSHH